MLGALIGAGVSALGELGNAISTSKANKRLKAKLEGQQAGAEGDATADRYGDWRYSGSNLYFRKAADEMKDYVAQQRAARKVSGAVDNGSAVKAAGQTIGNAASQANASRQAVGMQMYQQDKQRANAISDQINQLDAQNSQAQTQAWGQLAQTAGNLATSIGSSIEGGISAKKAKNNIKYDNGNIEKPNLSSGNESPIIDTERAQNDVGYQQDVRKAILGGL